MTSNENSVRLAVERQRIIRDLLQRERAVRSTQLQEILNVSLMTVRSDLRELEKAGECQLVWGGAVSTTADRVDDATVQRSRFNSEEKARIGESAVKYVQDGQTIIVDAGTTTVELIYHLPPTLETLRLITPSLTIAMAAARYPQLEVIVPGGIVRNLTLSLVGSQTTNALETINADWTFLSASAFSVKRGITTSDAREVYVKKTMISQAERVILLADSSKFGKVNAMKVAPLTDIDVLITDDKLTDEAAEAMTALGVKVVRV